MAGLQVPKDGATKSASSLAWEGVRSKGKTYAADGLRNRKA
jgi:hypothetical protein